MKKILLPFILIFSLYAFNAHKFYIALTEIELNSEKQSVQMIMNVFIDDIETAINKDYSTDLQLNTKKENTKVDEFFLKYLKKHFYVTIDDKKCDYNFIGKEYDGDLVYFYLEIENIQNLKNIEIQNDVLIEHFPDQQNLIKVKVNGERKSLFLTNSNDKGLLTF